MLQKSSSLGHKSAIKFIFILDYVFMNRSIISYNVFRYLQIHLELQQSQKQTISRNLFHILFTSRDMLHQPCFERKKSYRQKYILATYIKF